jgi:MFS family permease
MLVGVALTALTIFVRHERRIDHPIVPVELFRLRVFTVANLTGFVVGVGMFGAIMFVPLFVQGVLGGSATSSGLVLTPLMLALIIASVASGQIISRTGRYRWALLTGPVVMTAGFLGLSGLDEHSTRAAVTLATVLLGFGLGLLMQNLVLVVQNAVPSRDLGAATSAGQFSRQIGGTIGVSVMGAILASGLGSAPASGANLAHAMHPVFVIGVPLALVALVLVTLVPELPLRRSVREDAPPQPAPATP